MNLKVADIVAFWPSVSGLSFVAELPFRGGNHKDRRLGHQHLFKLQKLQKLEMCLTSTSLT